MTLADRRLPDLCAEHGPGERIVWIGKPGPWSSTKDRVKSWLILHIGQAGLLE
jgi:hypothetical protein